MEHEASFARSDLEHMLVDETAEPKAMPLALLKDITGGFSVDREIGRGGFAVVYKGELGRRAVAVKSLTDAFMDDTKFHQEVACLMSVKHKNIVRFLGYCALRQGEMQMYQGRHVMADIHHRLLCFEYLFKGSLDKHFTDIHREWPMCYKIIKGICEGLQYLHANGIIHLDLKPANILLDNHMIPKISDFGLSRHFHDNQSQIITQNVIGTLGYLAPEIHRTGIIKRSADLYSLGVVIMEILTGEKWYQETEEVLIKSWSDRLEGSQREILCKQIQVCYKIALKCTKSNPRKRPDSAQSIIDRLAETESIIDRLAETESIIDSLGATQSIPENVIAELLSGEEELRIEGCDGGLVFYNKGGVELLKNSDVSHITLSDLQKLNSLRSIHFKGCDNMFSADLDDSVVLHLVRNLHIEKLGIDGELFSQVLRCFPALSRLTITKCRNLKLVPVEDGGLSDLRTLHYFEAFSCGKLFSRWHMGEVSGGAHAMIPFPTSLRELDIFLEPSMQSMGLLSNLTALTFLHLKSCEELTMDGFNPLITINLKELCVDAMYSNEEGNSIAGYLLSEISRSKLMCAGSFPLEEFRVDSISSVLTAPICSHLAVTIHTLKFSFDQRVIIFTEEQEQALNLLTCLKFLKFDCCKNLQSLPQGLHGLSSLKRLRIEDCEKLRSLPPKEGLPASLKTLQVKACSPEVTKQAEELKGADPWFSVEILAS